MDIQVVRRVQKFVTRRTDAWLFTQDLYLKTGLFLHLTQQCLLGVLVKLNMPTRSNPFAISGMVDEQHFTGENYKYRNREVDVLVNMTHVLLRFSY